jgi:hypothetical protein
MVQGLMGRMYDPRCRLPRVQGIELGLRVKVSVLISAFSAVILPHFGFACQRAPPLNINRFRAVSTLCAW